jgi:ketosteroid isomerase-like protein
MFSLTTLSDNRRKNLDALAEAFSVGQFEEVFDYLEENIVWTIPGETELQGKQAVFGHCKQVKEYFNSLTTRFEIQDTLSDFNKVVVKGAAEFIRDNQIVSTVSACDVYEFNRQHKIIKITSYCIKH